MLAVLLYRHYINPSLLDERVEVLDDLLSGILFQLYKLFLGLLHLVEMLIHLEHLLLLIFHLLHATFIECLFIHRTHPVVKPPKNLVLLLLLDAVEGTCRS